MKSLLGGILIAAGILIAGASGLCSLYMLVTSDMFSTGRSSELLSMIPVILIVGGIPFATGIGLVVAGRRIISNARPAARHDGHGQ